MAEFKEHERKHLDASPKAPPDVAEKYPTSHAQAAEHRGVLKHMVSQTSPSAETVLPKIHAPLPANASEADVNKKLSADSADSDASLRKGLGLPANASEADVKKKLSADSEVRLRHELGLPPNASEEDVSKKITANSAATLRKDLGLPVNASDADVDKAFAEKTKGY